MAYQFLQPWHAFLPREGGHVVSLFGGGGKTSLLATWTELYRQEGIPVAITTTTRTEPLNWDDLVVQEWQEVATVQSASPAGAIFVKQGKHGDGKWRGLSVNQVDRLSELLPERVILVEADGSGGLPVKLHREDEPLFPARTSLAVAVVGLSAIGRPIADVLHRAGELPGPWSTVVAAADLFDWDRLLQLLIAHSGYLGRIPQGVPAILALTQLACLEDGLGLFGFLDRMMEQVGLPLVVLSELADCPPWIRTAYRIQDGESAAVDGLAQTETSSLGEPDESGDLGSDCGEQPDG